MLLKSIVHRGGADISVGNLAFGHFFGKLFGFPLKTEKSPHGLLTEAEMFEILGAIFAFLFFNADEVWGLKLKTATVAAYKQVSELLKLNIAKVKVGEFINGSKDKPPSGDFVELYGQHLIERMVNDKKNKSTDEIVTQVLLTASGLANLSAEVPLRFCKPDGSSRNCLISICPMSISRIGRRLSVYLNLTTMIRSRN